MVTNENMMLKLSAVVFISLLVAVNGDDECDSRILDDCMSNGALSIGYRTDLPDEEFLNERCGPALDSLECVKDAVKNCPELSEITADAGDIDRGITFLHSMCNENSTLRKGYLENLECYNNMLPNVSQCILRRRHILLSFELIMRNITDAIDKYPHCLLRLLLKDCLIEKSIALCGEEGAEAMIDITLAITSVVREASCPDEDVLRDLRQRFVEYLEENLLEEKRR